MLDSSSSPFPVNGVMLGAVVRGVMGAVVWGVMGAVVSGVMGAMVRGVMGAVVRGVTVTVGGEVGESGLDGGDICGSEND